MKLLNPCIITPRLLPGVQIGNAFISIKYSDRPGDNGRDRYRYYIDADGLEYTGDDIQSGCQGGSLQEGLSSLLGFLSAQAESIEYTARTGRESDNCDLFPAEIGEWAVANDDEISTLSCELEETEGLIEE